VTSKRSLNPWVEIKGDLIVRNHLLGVKERGKEKRLISFKSTRKDTIGKNQLE